MHVVLGAFQRQRLHQAHQRQFGRAIIGLAKIAVQPGGRRRHQDAAIALLAHQFPHSLRAVDTADQVNVHHGAEIVQRHLHECLVAQDAGIVDQDIDAAPTFLDVGDHLFHSRHVGDAGAIGHGFAAERGDFIHNGLRRRERRARTIASAAEIVDDHLGATPRQIKRIGPAQAAAGTGNNGNTPFKADGHEMLFP